MSTRKRIALIIVLLLAGFCSAAYTGLFNVSRWNTATSSSFSRAHGGVEQFMPYFAPDGNWLVYIDAPASIRDPLVKSLAPELKALTVGRCEVVFVDAVPAAKVGVNQMTVTIEPQGLWTPATGKFADKATINIATAAATLPPDELTLVPGMVRIKGEYTTAGTAYGLVSRPHMNAYRANMIRDFIVKTIKDTYAEIRAKLN